jgi:3'-phosphoadenosine 5'-phosphosulfate sulfotransferase (PAPS reductase)/FAD synthetase
MSAPMPAALIADAKERFNPVLTVACFSGGNDSATMLHAVKDSVDRVLHIDTGTGIPETQEFVKSLCAEWGLKLDIERTEHSYEDLVLKYGFPGPASHLYMYSWLKERPLRAYRRRWKTKPTDVVLFVAGIRQTESNRRFYAGYEPITKVGGFAWCNAIFDWTADDLARYRELHQIPRSQVADTLHMSGECLCGSFAHPGELDEIALWYPEVAQRIRDLEHKAEQAGVPCRWGQAPPRKQIEGQGSFEVAG